MKTANKEKKSVELFFYSIVAVLLIVSTMAMMIGSMYQNSKSRAYERMHVETRRVKEELNLQMMSDRENLMTMAQMAAELHESGESYDLLFKAFKAIGLFENIGILTPDNIFTTKNGSFDLNGKLSFVSESHKGQYVTGRVTSLSEPSKEVVRSAVPVVISDGTIVAMMYGIINLKTLREKYIGDVKSMNADLFVVEGGNGNLLINTKDKSIRNITELAVTKFNEGYTYDALIRDLSKSQNGYTSFEALTTTGTVYAHYAPLAFGDWQIMFIEPEEVVFGDAISSVNFLVLNAVVIILIMMGYAMLIFLSERKHLKINRNSSNIRKLLLGINQKPDRIYEALQWIADFSDAKAAFIVDSYGVDYQYVLPTFKKTMKSEEQNQLISMLFEYVAKRRRQYHNEVYISKIKANKNLLDVMPELYGFLKKHAIDGVQFACVANDNGAVSLLGVIQPKYGKASELLEDIAICFTMAIHNQKHLAKTEAMAHTDALTGVANRMAYKDDVQKIMEYGVDKLICIYIDVNELNHFNNEHGHAAGDQMLVFISETLQREFSDGKVYRMGGDEFLIFLQDKNPSEIEAAIQNANTKIEEMKYHVSIGVRYGAAGDLVEDIVNAAEKVMYTEKAKYYQSKQASTMANVKSHVMETEHTGIKEIDAYMSVMSARYYGVYCVNHKNDSAQAIVAPTYFAELLREYGDFTTCGKRYIYDVVKPEYHRSMLQFLNYEVLEEQLACGITPRFTYTKIDGEKATMSIYAHADREETGIDTVWVFEKVIE